MVIDTAAVKDRVDLLDLVGRDTRLRKVASTRGGEFAGPCPFCGGRDRLHVQPVAGAWMCRACGNGQWRDAIDYVRERDGCDFADACRSLGSETLHTGRPVRRPLPEADPEPTGAWRARGLQQVDQCAAALWSEAGIRARAYLHRRGLTDETLERWRVGFQARDAFEPRDAWGMDPRTGVCVWLPRGITIPWLVAGEVWQIKVRRAAGEPKYASISGGHPVLFGADTIADHSIAILTEGEFDAMLLHQEAGGLVGAATLGSCSKGLAGRAVALLLPLTRLIVAYDNDSDGQRGTARMLAISPRMRSAKVPIGKDLTEFWQQGGRIRDWVQFHLASVDVDELQARGGGPWTA